MLYAKWTHDLTAQKDLPGKGSVCKTASSNPHTLPSAPHTAHLPCWLWRKKSSVNHFCWFWRSPVI
jgi:hypothetical protein